VKRNVALLCDVPRGTAGRPSKSLALAQAADLLTAAGRQLAVYAYIVVSLLTGAVSGSSPTRSGGSEVVTDRSGGAYADPL
jgi:hypothetical protein